MTVKELRYLLFDVKNQDAVVKIDGLNILDVEASRFDPYVQLLNEKTHGQREARERRWAKDYLRESLKRPSK